MFQFILLTSFLASLPWVWVDILPIAYTVRPSIIFSIPLIAYFLLANKKKIQIINFKILAIIIFMLLIWIVPAIMYENPHWNLTQITSMFVYAFFAYLASHAYLHITSQSFWKHYWFLTSVILLASTIISFYFAFGTLVPNTAITSSRHFIQNELFSNVFSGEGKGVRHTLSLTPIILAAISLHNQNYSKIWSYSIIAVCTYLVFFTFSRSSWLAMFLVYLVMASYILKSMSVNFLKIFVILFFLTLIILFLISQNPEIYNWASNIFADRVAGDGSTQGRYWVIGFILFDTTIAEYLSGYNREFQQSPHNMILSALMHAGIIGMIGPTILFIYCIKKYLYGLLKPGIINLIASAFIACALVRIVTAGSGLLHFGELFGLFVAANLLHYRTREFKQRKIFFKKN